MYKKLLCILILLAVFAVPINTSAVNNAGFFLTDVNCDKNSLFENTLCTTGEVAAFTACLTYDKNTLEFKGASAIDESSVISVNSNVPGKIKIAYLCKEGATGDLIVLSFKSRDTSSHIALAVEQVIDKSFNDIAVEVKGAEITINTDTSQNADKAISEKSTETSTACTEINDSTHIKETVIQVPSNKSFDPNAVIGIVGSALVFLAVAGIAFFLGRKSSEK